MSFQARQLRQAFHGYPKSEDPATIRLPDPLSDRKTPLKEEMPQRITNSPTSGTDATSPIKQAQTPKRGKLPIAPRQFKYAIVIVDYNLKWIEAERLATITTDKGTTIFYASPTHPQTNSQVESINKLIKQNLKKCLEEAKGLWAAKLPDVLGTLRTTPTTATWESPYLLAYGTEAMIPVEMEVPSDRVTAYDPETNAIGLRLNMDLLEELRAQEN
ncbi:hypothetical protein ACLB2K_065952 [Fragaria x ananassa]